MKRLWREVFVGEVAAGLLRGLALRFPPLNVLPRRLPHLVHCLLANVAVVDVALGKVALAEGHFIFEAADGFFEGLVKVASLGAEWIGLHGLRAEQWARGVEGGGGDKWAKCHR